MTYRLRSVQLKLPDFHPLVDFDGSRGWVLGYNLETAEAQVMMTSGAIVGTTVTVEVHLLKDINTPTVEDRDVRQARAPGERLTHEKKQGAEGTL